MTQILYYLDAYTDEVIPCAPTLETWADWLSKPAEDWSCRVEATEDGATFKVSTLELLGDIRVEHDGQEWVAVTPIPQGANGFYRRHFEGSTGWDADYSSDNLKDATDCIELDEGPLFYACTQDGPNYVATYRAEPPHLVLEPVQ